MAAPARHCEDGPLLLPLLPAALLEEGGELQWGRACQGKVTDFKFLLLSQKRTHATARGAESY